MALKRLQSLVLPVTAAVVDNGTGLERKLGTMRSFAAFLSYPRHDSPSYPMADPDVRPGRFKRTVSPLPWRR